MKNSITNLTNNEINYIAGGIDPMLGAIIVSGFILGLTTDPKTIINTTKKLYNNLTFNNIKDTIAKAAAFLAKTATSIFGLGYLLANHNRAFWTITLTTLITSLILV